VDQCLKANKHIYVLSSPEDKWSWSYKSSDPLIRVVKQKYLMVWHGTGEPADFELFLKSMMTAKRGERDIVTLSAKAPIENDK
jgi:hypothetical protein